MKMGAQPSAYADHSTRRTPEIFWHYAYHGSLPTRHWPVVCTSVAVLPLPLNPTLTLSLCITPSSRRQFGLEELKETPTLSATMQDVYNEALVRHAHMANFMATQLPFSITAFVFGLNGLDSRRGCLAP